MAEFDLGNIFRQAFGYEPPTRSEDIRLAQAKERRKQSRLGQNFFDTDLLGREYFLPVYLNDWLVPFAVLGMTWKKTIVSTPMPERGGSVKELISIDDYLFSLKGILINEENDFPDGDVMQVHDIFKINKSVVLRSVLSDIVLSGKSSDGKNDPDGHKVVIKEVRWPEVVGIEHAKPFEMELESDMIFDLEID